MKITVRSTKEVEVNSICLNLPVRYGDEDIPYDFPMRSGDMWCAIVDIETGVIFDWPKDSRYSSYAFSLKVCDEGIYTLLDKCGKTVARLDSYVPHGIVPGEYGVYVKLVIENGKIINWPKNPDVSGFF